MTIFSPRKMCASSSQTSTAGDRSRLLSLADRGRRGGQLERKRDDEARALTWQRLGPHAAAVRLDEPFDDRQPSPSPFRRTAEWRRGRKRRTLASGPRADPWPAVDDADPELLADDPRAHRHWRRRRVAQGVFHQVRERTVELNGVGADERQVGIDRERESSPTGIELLAASRSNSSTEHHWRRGSALPPCSRERSSSFSTNAVSRPRPR